MCPFSGKVESAQTQADTEAKVRPARASQHLGDLGEFLHIFEPQGVA